MDSIRITYSAESVDDLIASMRPTASLLERRFSSGVSIYGAGFVGSWASDYLRSIGVKITNFVDRDPRKTGSLINGIPVIAPTSPDMHSISGMLIAVRQVVRSVERDLAALDCPKMSFDGYFVVRNSKRLLKIRDTYLSDHRSIETFNALLTSMLTGRLDPCRAVMEKDMYFSLPEFSGDFNEIFVDAGAFVGDTVERFIWENLGTFRHIYAFEPGNKQFAALERRVARLAEEWAFDSASVSLVKAGLAEAEGEMDCTYVDDFPIRHGLVSRVKGNARPSDPALTSRICTLDGYLGDRPVTFIKADVEGMEMSLLKGAVRAIQRNKPKMALCVYHYPSDLFSIPEFIRAIVPDYRFSLRQHAPIFGDFVLYCWCDEE
jgi:FkbM family methyltransferase